MIVSEIFYGVKCNRCGEQFEDGEHSFWSDENSAEENAMESEWIWEKNGKHYCPNCYELDEETEDTTPLPEFPEHLKKLKSFIDKNLKSYCSSIIETDDFFKVETGIYNGSTLASYEENYIKEFLGEKLISLEYQKHERFTRYDCIITIKK